MENLIKAENIVKSFGKKERNVIDDLTLDIGKGEFIAVMGPSGSGKSTLLYALSGMDPVQKGRVSFMGKDLSLLSEKEKAEMLRTGMGFVFQQPTLLKNLNILDNIMLPACRRGGEKREIIAQRARAYMEKTGIGGLEDREITQVSGGQLQRAGLCRALMNNPPILFGDEPTGALNSRTVEEVMDLFSLIHAEGRTVFLVTHDARVAARAERVLFMADGKIVEETALPAMGGGTREDRVGLIRKKMEKIGI